MSGDADGRSEEEQAIEMFKIKKLISSLEKARGCVLCAVREASLPVIFSAVARSRPPPHGGQLM